MDASQLGLAGCYPFGYDVAADALSFIRLGETGYARASFLDQRIGPAASAAEWVDWPSVLAAIDPAAPRDCRFVFHIGHVGSTLLSRLIGEHPDILSLREPLPLRTLATVEPDLARPESFIDRAGYELRRDALLALWSRGFRPGQRAVVKATSFASEIAPELLARVDDPCALLMHVAPEAYIAGILAGPASRQEIRAMAPLRLRRLHRRLGADAWRLIELDEGARIAMSWACEMTALLAAETVPAARLAWLDFEQFLARPADNLSRAFALFGAALPEAQVDALATGPLMTRYSKAPEQAYSATLRAGLLQQARREHRAELASGLAWLDAAARAHPLVARAIGRGSAGMA